MWACPVTLRLSWTFSLLFSTLAFRREQSDSRAPSPTLKDPKSLLIRWRTRQATSARPRLNRRATSPPPPPISLRQSPSPPRFSFTASGTPSSSFQTSLQTDLRPTTIPSSLVPKSKVTTLILRPFFLRHPEPTHASSPAETRPGRGLDGEPLLSPEQQ